LSLTAVVDYSFTTSVDVSDDQRLRLVALMQAGQDFDELAATLIKHKRCDLLLALTSREGLLRTKNQSKIAIGAFKASLHADELALAL